MKTVKSAAIITIHNAPTMHTRGRKSVAAWMRKQADFLEKHAKELPSKFVARYLYNS